MPSPFPGMDPYLEAHWRDIHARLIIFACDAIQTVLPTALRARVEESVLLETPIGLGDHPLYPDVRVVEYAFRRGLETQVEGSFALGQPLLLEVVPEPITETFIEIIDRATGNRAVTVIELLSPSNKSPGPNREQYQLRPRSGPGTTRRGPGLGGEVPTSEGVASADESYAEQGKSKPR